MEGSAQFEPSSMKIGWMATPFDVRKACGFPLLLPNLFEATPRNPRHSLEKKERLTGKAQPFRTSGGRAA